MQTRFTPAQIADPMTGLSAATIRKCVHCGFCLATCPTYVLLGNELDSPRGRVYLIKEMLEHDAKPSAEVVKHIDRCLSCMACMTTCPSGVDYRQLIDHAREYIAANYRRPLLDRSYRALLAAVLPHPWRFRLALRLGRVFSPLAPLLAHAAPLLPLAAMLRLARDATGGADHSMAPPQLQIEPKLGRVILMQGCAEPVLRPQIQTATVRMLTRMGYKVAFAPGEKCCGALVQHIGLADAARNAARRNVDAWSADIAKSDTPVVAIIITVSGCGPTVKQYASLLAGEPAYAVRAAQVSALAIDISEFLMLRAMPSVRNHTTKVAYHAACSLQHGQRLHGNAALLTSAGFEVSIPAEAHLCCGSAGTYNILQPAIADQLGDRKAENIGRLRAEVIATTNIGCAVQIGQRVTLPVVHVVELLDWAYGGPLPIGMTSPVQED